MTHRALLLLRVGIHQGEPDRHFTLAVHAGTDDLPGRVRVVLLIQVADSLFGLARGAGPQDPRALINEEVERPATAIRATRVRNPVLHATAVPAEDVPQQVLVQVKSG